MTVTSLPVRDEYTGVAAQTVFNYTFKIYAIGQLNVYVTPSGQTANDSTDIITTYTIDPGTIGNPLGGFITLDSGVSSGDLITIVSNIPESRTTDYQNSGDFLPDVVDDDFDTVVSLTKQEADRSGRTLAFPESLQNATGLTLSHPAAGLYLAWKSDESGVENVGAPGAIQPSELTGTTAQMVANASLVAGEYILTSGHSANGDGGDNVFLSRAYSAGTYDGGSLIRGVGNTAIEFVGLFPGGVINSAQFGASDGIDCTTAITNAYTYADGLPVWHPVGTLIITSTITLIPTRVGTFNQGPQIIGQGMGKTIFDNQVSSGAMFDIQQAAGATNFAMGAMIKNFKVTHSTGSTQTAIKILANYMVDIDNVHIHGGDIGIHIPVILGDLDGANMISIRRTRIENCSTWGIKADADPTKNEFSFFHLEQVFIQACGTVDASLPPTSGGMIWKGQIMTMDQCALVLCQNVGLYITNTGGGLGSNATLTSTTFENNYLRSLYCDGISNMVTQNCQMYNGITYGAIRGMEFDGSASTIREVSIRNTKIRANVGLTSFVGYTISGANVELGTCSVEGTVWETFSSAVGQVSFSGWKDKPSVIAYKAAAQNIFNTASAVLFDTETADLQSVYDPATGLYAISYEAPVNFKGDITVAGLSAGDAVTIELYNASDTVIVASVIRSAGGLASETFHYDFTIQAAEGMAAAGATKSYSIRAFNSVGTKALDVTDAGFNTLNIRRLEEQIDGPA